MNVEREIFSVTADDYSIIDERLNSGGKVVDVLVDNVMLRHKETDAVFGLPSVCGAESVRRTVLDVKTLKVKFDLQKVWELSGWSDFNPADYLIKITIVWVTL